MCGVHVEIISDGELKERFFIICIDVEVNHLSSDVHNISEFILSSHK